MTSVWGSSWGSSWGDAWGAVSGSGTGGGTGGGTATGLRTVRWAINRALRRIEVIAAGAQPSAEEAQDALDELNVMLWSFPREGIAYEHVELALSDVFNMDDGLSMYVSNMLTERLAGEYGRQLTPTQAEEADMARRLLQAAYREAVVAGMDPAISYHKRGRYYG